MNTNYEERIAELRKTFNICNCNKQYVRYYPGGKKKRFKQNDELLPPDINNKTIESRFSENDKNRYNEFIDNQQMMCSKCDNISTSKNLKVFIDEINRL
jgi:hypothetical protein